MPDSEPYDHDAAFERELPGLLIRRGLPRYDAVGLFVQWLAERVSMLDAPFLIEIDAGAPEAKVRLLVEDPRDGTTHAHTWHVGLLNDLLEKANGRGDLLRKEIRSTAADLSARLDYEA